MLTDKGAVYCSGYGFCGSAGQQPEGMGGDEDTSYHVPQPIPLLTNSIKIEIISAGPMHSAAISTSGKLYTWGFGRFGMLGHGSTDSCQVRVNLLLAAFQI